jgi:hypothetical protein
MHTPHRVIPKIIIVAAAAGLLALAAIVLTPSPAPADPVIRWTPQSVIENVTPGASKTISVSLVSSEDVANVAVRVVPALEPFVQIGPTSFPQLLKGQPATLSVTIAANHETPFGVFDGTIHLTLSQKTLAKSLPLNVTYSVVPVPPDPGEVGKATLAGVDADSNGVRDDIQRYIVLTYPDSERTRAALIQAAQAVQGFLVETGGRETIIARAEEKGRATDCLSFITSLDDRIYDELKARILNTAERSRRWITNDVQLSGHVFTIPSPDDYKLGCNFNPAAMEN